MKAIIEGVRSFREHGFKENQELFQVLAHGQSPRYLLITCADSRVVPNLITGLGPGDIFTIRNAGNIVPPPSAGPSGEAAAIEFAVVELKVKHIIICGHSHCGAMTSLLHRETLEKLPSVAGFLLYADQARRNVKARYPRLEGEELVTQIVKENVLVQLNHLKSTSAVSAAIRRGELQVHGWVFMIETGVVLAYDTISRQFITVEEWLRERS
jgi:carbonic anhydrase